MRSYLSFIAIIGIVLFASSCADTRIHEKEDWQQTFQKYGIKDACFMLRDHTHDEVYYYNLDRCSQRFAPASTFKILNSLIALETATAPDDKLIIPWDSVTRDITAWNKTMNMREAFKVSNVPYYQELARRIGYDYMQHYVDTVQYGNRRLGNKIDEFWLNDTLQISADEQLGFIKKLYFDELPFSDRSQRIVRSMMLQEDTLDYKLYYKTGTIEKGDAVLCRIVGFVEHIVKVEEHENSMNKSDVRIYPYFFAENFTVPKDPSKDWYAVRLKILHEFLEKEVFAKK